MKDTVNDRLYKEVAAELGISEKLVHDVINNGQSKCTAMVITSNTFDGVRWPFMGSFRAKHKSVQILSHMRGLNKIQKEFFLQRLKEGNLTNNNGHNGKS